MTNRVAVLVAVYNSSRYLRQCIESLISQTLSDIQILAIDDCSTDNSLEILQEYAIKDSRIEVIQLTSNYGQAHARNIGLQYVDADYVCMLDSDDWFSADALEKAISIFDCHHDVDSVLFQLIEYDNSKHTVKLYPMPEKVDMTGMEAFKESLTWNIHGLYMVRTSIHKKYPYDETTKLYSDDNTTRLHYLHSHRVMSCSGIYYYRQHEASMTHQISFRRFDYLRANESMKRQLISENVDNDILNIYENHRWLNLVGIYMYYFLHRKEMSYNDRCNGLKEIHRVWGGIEKKRLNADLKNKFGYMPLLFCWSMFRFEEELYFIVRRLFGRL
jgi:glycosyltransferase involved in cell wall biosynthesis